MSGTASKELLSSCKLKLIQEIQKFEDQSEKNIQALIGTDKRNLEKSDQLSYLDLQVNMSYEDSVL